MRLKKLVVYNNVNHRLGYDPLVLACLFHTLFVYCIVLYWDDVGLGGLLTHFLGLQMLFSE